MKSFNFVAFGQKWKVKVCRTHPKIIDQFGYLEEDENIIYITTDATEDQQWSTFLHELIHLVSLANGLNLSENTTLCLEGGLFQILKGNKITF